MSSFGFSSSISPSYGLEAADTIVSTYIKQRDAQLSGQRPLDLLDLDTVSAFPDSVELVHA